MLWLSVHFPLLPLDVFSPVADQPLVVEASVRQRRLVLYANAAAQVLGITSGMSISNAQGLCESLAVKPRASAMEVELLQRVAISSYQVTPHIAICPPNSVLLEVETCLHLFGGCNALLRQLQAILDEIGANYTIACFPTAQGAKALARSQVPLNEAVIFPLEALQDCPLTSTDLSCQQIERLEGMGMTRLRDLFLLPSSALGRRFGPEIQFYLQQLHGQHPVSRPHFILPPIFQTRMELGHETSQQEALLFPLKRLLTAQENYLRARQLLVTSVTVSLQHRDLSIDTITVSPSQGLFKCVDWLELFRLRLEKHVLKQPIIAISVNAMDFFSWAPVAKDLFTAHANTDMTLEALVDRLQARIGDSNLYCVVPAHDHRPEKAFRKVSPGEKGEADFPAQNRPWWILPTPKPLVAKKGVPCDGVPLTLLEGPERMTLGWWDQTSMQRDYYIAKNEKSGALYWVYRTVRESQWFLHGIFG